MDGIHVHAPRYWRPLHETTQIRISTFPIHHPSELFHEMGFLLFVTDDRGANGSTVVSCNGSYYFKEVTIDRGITAVDHNGDTHHCSFEHCGIASDVHEIGAFPFPIATVGSLVRSSPFFLHFE